MPTSDRKAIPPLALVEGNNVTLNRDRVKRLTGSSDENFGMALIRRTAETLWRPGSMDADRCQQELNAAIVAMAAFKPQDEIEGMLAAQAVALNAASMECLRRGMIPDQGFEAGREYRKAGANLARAFTEMLDALDRKRGKNRKQVMRIERVTVEAGGQAIVGNVAPGAAAGGGGMHGSEVEGEPHGAPTRLAHDATFGAALPALRGEEPGREPLPVAGDARESPLPAARRQKHRAANG